MKKSIINSIFAVAVAASMSSCTSSWLETDLYSGVDSESALENPAAIGYALNGTYYRLQQYYFAGNYATVIGDIASDIVYWTGDNGHQNNLYQFNYTDTDVSLGSIWQYGYMVVDNSARVIEASEAIIGHVTETEQYELQRYMAEARCLRAYANLVMANVFCHQAMVNGTSYLDQPGLVIVDKPVEAYSQVERASLGDTYAFIVEDLEKAVAAFTEYGDRRIPNYFGLASAYGLLARANLYLENWDAAATAADNAIQVSGIEGLAYTAEEYMDLYSGDDTNWESMFMLAIDITTNWSANSCGTLFSTYGYSHSPYLFSLYGEDDVRTSVMYWTGDGKPYNNNYSGAKFYFGGGNTAVANNFLINAPEMFLIQAEAYTNLSQVSNAQNALLVVAMRNPAITSTADLPSNQNDLMAFIKEERARELFQEGFRLWDLRRWDTKANLYAVSAPDIDWLIKDANCADIVMPIPVDEINAGFGVTQNQGWAGTRPK